MPDSGKAYSHAGFVLWFTGMSGAGKSTLSQRIYDKLRAAGAKVELLDGDEVREHLSKGLGFTKEDRDTNVARIGYVARLLARNGVIAITAAISPYREARQSVREQSNRFVEVFMDCPLQVLATRDVKGLYKKAMSGEIPHFTGVSDPYEAPLEPEVHCDTSQESLADSEAKVWSTLIRLGLIAEKPV